MTRWGAGAAGALALLISVAANASAATDLSRYLASPQGSGWNRVSGPRILDGPFTAHSYAAFVDASNGTPGTSEAELTAYGFVAGFAREWYQPDTSHTLVERVFQFNQGAGASQWFGGLKSQPNIAPYVKSSFDTAAIPNSFGLVLIGSDGTHQWRLDFVRGRLVFIIHTDSSGDDLSSLAGTQARAEYGLAADQPGTTGGFVSGASIPGWAFWAIGGASALVLLASAGIVLAFVLAGRRRPQAPMPFAGGPMMSPDGYYWWDGARWRLVATDPPPTPRT